MYHIDMVSPAVEERVGRRLRGGAQQAVGDALLERCGEETMQTVVKCLPFFYIEFKEG
jgi:hypothetical protein